MLRHFVLAFILLPSYLAAQQSQIYFESDHSELKKEDRAQLKEFVEAIGGADGIVVIEGFADTTGNTVYNLKLSRERARAVESAIILHGYPSKRIRTSFFGERDDPPGSKLEIQRRVDVKFVPAEVNYAEDVPGIRSDLVEELLAPRLQYITFDNRFPRKVSGKDGTVVTLEKLALKTKNQDPYRSEVVMEMREFSKTTHLLNSGIATNLGGDLLEVGGMAFIAFHTPEGEPIEIRDGKSVLVAFPTDTLKDDMEIFVAKTDHFGNMAKRQRRSRESIETAEGRVYKQSASKRDAFITMGIDRPRTVYRNAVPLYEGRIYDSGYHIFARGIEVKDVGSLLVQLPDEVNIPTEAVIVAEKGKVIVRTELDPDAKQFTFERLPLNKPLHLVVLDLRGGEAFSFFQEIVLTEKETVMEAVLKPLDVRGLRGIEGL